MTTQPEQPEQLNPPPTLVESLGLSHLAALGVNESSQAALLAWRRAVRRGQIEGTGGQPQQERLRWK